jgi:hypothetical protein
MDGVKIKDESANISFEILFSILLYECSEIGLLDHLKFYIKLKCFYSAKETINKVAMKPTENICTLYI